MPSSVETFAKSQFFQGLPAMYVSIAVMRMKLPFYLARSVPRTIRPFLSFPGSACSPKRVKAIQVTLSAVDYVILVLYFAFVLGIGWRLRKSVTSAGEFLTGGHKVPVWITSLAFLAANLARVLGVLFVLAMLALIGALIIFLREIFIAITPPGGVIR